LNYLTVDEVLGIHESAIESHGGEYGVLNLGLIESAIESARQTFDGKPLHKSLHEVTAAYWFSLTKNHAFLDGNKRTAAISAAYFLFKNDHALAMDDDQIIDTSLGIATSVLRREELVERISRAIEPLTP
jgi:death-on-curing protein